tara:strand:+ start:330 stop:521 length:192 start_codon:yes stop_codon:yes gene_type:complete
MLSAEYIAIVSASFIGLLLAVCKSIRMSRCAEIDCCFGAIKVKRDVLDKDEIALELEKKTGEP